MKYLSQLLLTLFLSTPVLSNAQEDSIDIVSDLWPGATQQDGTGLYWQLVKAAFNHQQIQVHTRHMPYARSVSQVRHQKADAWLGAYNDEVDNALYSKHHLDIDVILAIGPDDGRVITLQAMAGKTLAWLRGFSFDKYLPIQVIPHEVNTQKQALRMLQSGHGIYAYLTPSSLFEPEIKTSTYKREQFNVVPVLELPLHVAFQNTPRGIRLRQAFDRGFQQLLREGTVQKLYNQHQWGDYR